MLLNIYCILVMVSDNFKTNLITNYLKSFNFIFLLNFDYLHSQLYSHTCNCIYFRKYFNNHLVLIIKEGKGKAKEKKKDIPI